MSFSPIIPMDGLAGWVFLKRTRAQQEESFNNAPQIKRDSTYFEKAILKLKTVDDLINDPRSLRIALSAFGLQDDINNKAFIRKIITDGTVAESALSNRLSDRRYSSFAKFFEYLSPLNISPSPDQMAIRIITKYQQGQFEIAVGAQNKNMRLALSLQRELPQITREFKSQSAQWFALLGNLPLREVLQTSLGFPKEFSKLDIDTQLTRMRAAAKASYGTGDLTELSTPESLAKITNRFFAMSQIKSSREVLSGAATALILLAAPKTG